jgi:hypothetical protein
MQKKKSARGKKRVEEVGQSAEPTAPTPPTPPTIQPKEPSDNNQTPFSEPNNKKQPRKKGGRTRKRVEEVIDRHESVESPNVEVEHTENDTLNHATEELDNNYPNHIIEGAEDEFRLYEEEARQQEELRLRRERERIELEERDRLAREEWQKGEALRQEENERIAKEKEAEHRAHLEKLEEIRGLRVEKKEVPHWIKVTLLCISILIIGIVGVYIHKHPDAISQLKNKINSTTTVFQKEKQQEYKGFSLFSIENDLRLYGDPERRISPSAEVPKTMYGWTTKTGLPIEIGWKGNPDKKQPAEEIIIRGELSKEEILTTLAKAADGMSWHEEQPPAPVFALYSKAYKDERIRYYSRDDRANATLVGKKLLILSNEELKREVIRSYSIGTWKPSRNMILAIDWLIASALLFPIALASFKAHGAHRSARNFDEVARSIGCVPLEQDLEFCWQYPRVEMIEGNDHYKRMAIAARKTGSLPSPGIQKILNNHTIEEYKRKKELLFEAATNSYEIEKAERVWGTAITTPAIGLIMAWIFKMLLHI